MNSLNLDDSLKLNSLNPADTVPGGTWYEACVTEFVCKISLTLRNLVFCRICSELLSSWPCCCCCCCCSCCGFQRFFSFPGRNNSGKKVHFLLIHSISQKSSFLRCELLFFSPPAQNVSRVISCTKADQTWMSNGDEVAKTEPTKHHTEYSLLESKGD